MFSKKEIEQEALLQLFLSFVGMIVAFAWVLINKGSKFWLENWESHIDMLEDEFEGNLYKVVDTVDFKKNAWSVSKTNIHLSIFIFFCFSALFTIFFFQKIPLNCIKILLKNICSINLDVLAFLSLFVLAFFTAVIFIINVVFTGFKLNKILGLFALKFLRPKLDTKKDTTKEYDHEFTIRDRTYTLTEKAKDNLK